jgi:hypothetical protein
MRATTRLQPRLAVPSHTTHSLHCFPRSSLQILHLPASQENLRVFLSSIFRDSVDSKSAAREVARSSVPGPCSELFHRDVACLRQISTEKPQSMEKLRKEFSDLDSCSTSSRGDVGRAVKFYSSDIPWKRAARDFCTSGLLLRLLLLGDAGHALSHKSEYSDGPR